jgi:hypothetical protein
VFIEDFMLFDFEEWYMLLNNLKSYGQQIQSMLKNKQTNKYIKQNKNKTENNTNKNK